MKPPPFRYFAPQTLEGALALLQEHGAAAKPLAGGQSLIPAMNFRLMQPAVLIDLNRIAEIGAVQPAEDGLHLGAMVRQSALEHSEGVAKAAPLLHEAMPWIAHPQIRNRGTLGGSLAHADPAAELPAVMVALGANFRLQSQTADRWVKADQFYLGLFATALEPEELLTEIVVPVWPVGCGWSFMEIARRHGDYALAGVAVTLQVDGEQRCTTVRMVFMGVGDGPVRALSAEQALVGQAINEAAIRAAAEMAAARDIDPPNDIHASADYRRHLARVLATRALYTAAARTKSA